MSAPAQKTSPPPKSRTLESHIERCRALRDFISEACGKELFPYNREVSDAMIELTMRQDGEEMIVLQSRQSGKTETTIQTVLALSVYYISTLEAPFKVGIFAPAQSQAIQVTRDRFKSLFDELRQIFLKMNIITFLGEGRMTSIFILHNIKTGKEAKIRALSTDTTAHIKAETFNMIITEQTEDMDESKLKADVFPMLAAVGGVRVLSGTSTIGIVNRYFHNKVILPHPHKYIVDYKKVIACNPQYQAFIEKEKLRIGEDSLEFKTQYALEWGTERSSFIEDRNHFLSLREDYAPIDGAPRVAGWDPARGADWSVVTVLEGAGDRVHLIDWWASQGTNLEEQVGVVGPWLRDKRVSRVAVDSIGMGQGVCDILDNHYRGDFKVERVVMDVNTQDQMFKLLDSEIKTGRLRYPQRESRNQQMFIQQMLDAVRKYQGSRLLVENPQGVGMHDDFVDCYSSDTDILTEHGWVPISQLKRGVKVATLSRDGVLVFQEPTDYISYRLNGGAVICRGHNLDLIVTENHEMLVASKQLYPRLDFLLVKAKDLLFTKFRYKADAIWHGSGTDDFLHEDRAYPTDHLLPFIGIYLTHGACMDGKIFIENPKDDVRIDSIVSRFCQLKKKGQVLCFEDPTLESLLKSIEDGGVPSTFGHLSGSQIASMFRWLQDDDHGIRYYKSKRLVDSLQALCLKSGVSCSVLQDRHSRTPRYQLHFHRKIGVNSVFLSHKLYIGTARPITYDGRVYCVTVPNHVIYVRRNGHPCWSGNSLALAMWSLKKRTFKSGFVVAPF